jgi:plasmid stability protein
MELDMATIVLKDIPVELQKRLKERARRNGRSVGGLEGVVGTERPRRTAEEVRQLIEAARAVREELAAKGVSITDEEITAWKRWGRP